MSRIIAIAMTLLLAAPVSAQQPHPGMSNGRLNTADKTCLVDGDTLWLQGENIRLKDYDTQDPQTALCGGNQEKALASMASARMLELLNSNDWTIEYFCYDSTSSKRRLATIRIGGQDVGDF